MAGRSARRVPHASIDDRLSNRPAQRDGARNPKRRQRTGDRSGVQPPRSTSSFTPLRARRHPPRMLRAGIGRSAAGTCRRYCPTVFASAKPTRTIANLKEIAPRRARSSSETPGLDFPKCRRRGRECRSPFRDEGQDAHRDRRQHLRQIAALRPGIAHKPNGIGDLDGRDVDVRRATCRRPGAGYGLKVAPRRRLRSS